MELSPLCTVDELVDLAAQQKYGANIKNTALQRGINAFWKEHEINSARMMSNEPVEKGRTIVGISTAA